VPESNRHEELERLKIIQVVVLIREADQATNLDDLETFMRRVEVRAG
jgi:hypothetical protein